MGIDAKRYTKDAQKRCKDADAQRYAKMHIHAQNTCREIGWDGMAWEWSEMEWSEIG